MRSLGSLLASILLGAGLASPLAARVVDCTVSNYSDHPYDRASLVALIPDRQRHVLEGTTARFGDAVGTVIQDDESRLKWRYKVTLPRLAGMAATLSYTVIRPTGMLIVRVNPGGTFTAGAGMVNNAFEFAYTLDDVGDRDYVPVRRVTGACAER